jgi:hypothetical protein
MSLWPCQIQFARGLDSDGDDSDMGGLRHEVAIVTKHLTYHLRTRPSQWIIHEGVEHASNGRDCHPFPSKVVYNSSQATTQT